MMLKDTLISENNTFFLAGNKDYLELNPQFQDMGLISNSVNDEPILKHDDSMQEDNKSQFDRKTTCTVPGALEIEVMTQHYMGPLWIVAADKIAEGYAVYLDNQLTGTVFSKKVNNKIHWHSYQINDRELLAQIGEWIVSLFPDRY